MKPIKLEDLAPHARKQAEDQIAIQVANSQQGPVNAAPAEDTTERANPPVIISYHERRRRLRDPDNCFSKWVTDAIVNRGILQDDDASQVLKVIYSQEKITKEEEEETVILIESVK